MTVAEDVTVRQALSATLASGVVTTAVESRGKGVPALGRLSSVGRRLVARQAVDAVGPVLDVDLLEVAEKGWTTYDRLVAAGYRTAASGGQEVVELHRHTVRSTHRPTVDVLVDDHVVSTVHFALELRLDITSLVAVVRGGALVAAHPGPCSTTAALSCEGVDLPSVTVKTTLPGTLDLGRGLRLVPDDLPVPPAPVPREPSL